jgi:hypothetical protein
MGVRRRAWARRRACKGVHGIEGRWVRACASRQERGWAYRRTGEGEVVGDDRAGTREGIAGARERQLVRACLQTARHVPGKHTTA